MSESVEPLRKVETKKVLVIDDNLKILRSLKILIEQEKGIDVALASSVAEGKRELERSSFDSIITDYDIGDGNCFDVVGFIEQRNIRVPLILITAHGSKQLAIETLNKHFFAFLEKPIKPDDLRSVLNSALYHKNKGDSEEKLVTLGLNSGELLHELANPLNIVLNKLFLLKREIIKEKYSDKINDYIESIENTIRRTNHIISSSKKAIQGTYELSQFPFSQLSEDIKESCLPRATKQGVDLRLEFQPTLKVSGNKNHLLQILVNLINNAIDAVSSLKERWVQLQVEVRHGYLFFLITDSGSGISKELQEKIFHPLFTTKRGGGTGFGLFIVDRLVRSYGGRVFLNPDSPHTQFIVQIPQNEGH